MTYEQISGQGNVTHIQAYADNGLLLVIGQFSEIYTDKEFVTIENDTDDIDITNFIDMDNLTLPIILDISNVNSDRISNAAVEKIPDVIHVNEDRTSESNENRLPVPKEMWKSPLNKAKLSCQSVRKKEYIRRIFSCKHLIYTYTF
ncbi:hypothetical protein JTB14_002846 [Gonioctena quinquepunctata]|nr:hypothetical protein JTB14_002846 [Gonioctena quinquepunctata]